MARKKRKYKKSKCEYLEEKGKQFAKDLASRATRWELDFKKKLESLGIPFVFQYPVICNCHRLFVLDFYLPGKRLGIELDGRGHYTASGLKSDKIRTALLLKEGIGIIRFSNTESTITTSAKLAYLIENYVSKTS